MISKNKRFDQSWIKLPESTPHDFKELVMGLVSEESIRFTSFIISPTTSKSMERQAVDLSTFSITNVVYNVSTSLLKTEPHILPTIMPTEAEARPRSQSHNRYSPPPILAKVMFDLGFNVDFRYSIGSEHYGSCYIGKKRSQGLLTSFGNCEPETCFKVTDVERVSSLYEYKFLIHEAFCLKTLESENIVKTFDCIILEIMTPLSLSKFFITLQEHLPYEMYKLYFNLRGLKQDVPLQVTRYLFVQLLNGLCYIHSKSITHRDLKLTNLMLSKDFKLKIIDFGTAHLFQQSDNNASSELLNLTSTQCGSRQTFSPEVVQRLDYNPRSYDLWQSGLILLECVTDKRFGGFYEMISKNKRFDQSWIKLPESTPHDFKELVMGLVAEESIRFTMAQALSSDFVKLQNDDTFWENYRNGNIPPAFNVFTIDASTDGSGAWKSGK